LFLLQFVVSQYNYINKIRHVQQLEEPYSDVSIPLLGLFHSINYNTCICTIYLVYEQCTQTIRIPQQSKIIV